MDEIGLEEFFFSGWDTFKRVKEEDAIDQVTLLSFSLPKGFDLLLGKLSVYVSWVPPLRLLYPLTLRIRICWSFVMVFQGKVKNFIYFRYFEKDAKLWWIRDRDLVNEYITLIVAISGKTASGCFWLKTKRNRFFLNSYASFVF